MPQNEARAWWAEVADVRENIERRRSGDAAATADEGTPIDELAHVRARRRRFEREQAPAPAPPRRTGRFDRDHDDSGAPAYELVAAAPVELPAGAPRRPLVVPDSPRTVQITGRPGERTTQRLVDIHRRRAARGPVERVGPRPDKLAMWAVLLGLFLILVAATSSHAATLAI